MESATPRTMVLEFGMGVDVHGQDCTKAARRAVSDAIRHSSLPLLGQAVTALIRCDRMEAGLGQSR